MQTMTSCSVSRHPSIERERGRGQPGSETPDRALGGYGDDARTRKLDVPSFHRPVSTRSAHTAAMPASVRGSGGSTLLLHSGEMLGNASAGQPPLPCLPCHVVSRPPCAILAATLAWTCGLWVSSAWAAIVEESGRRVWNKGGTIHPSTEKGRETRAGMKKVKSEPRDRSTRPKSGERRRRGGERGDTGT